MKRKPVPVIRKKPRRSKSLRLARRGDVTGHPGHLLDDPGLKKVLRLARKAKRPGYTLPQTLMAIRAANPKAFVDRNLYQLKPGVRLKLPARTHFTLSHDDAEIGLIRQYHEFRKNRVRLLARKSRIVYED